MDEIAQLLAVAVAIRARKQLHLALFQYLVVEMKGDAGHAALVLFARPIDVEVAQSAHLASQHALVVAQVLVELELGVGVHVERPLELALLPEHRPHAVDRGARRVDEGRFLRLAPMQQHLRVFEVVLHDEFAVPLCGGGTSAFMDDRVDLAKLPARLDAPNEVESIHVVDDIAIGQVFELDTLLEIVNHQDVGNTTLVQRLDQVAAD